MKAFDFVPHHKINAKLAALEFDFFFLDSSRVIYLDVINEFVLILSFPKLLFFPVEFLKAVFLALILHPILLS